MNEDVDHDEIQRIRVHVHDLVNKTWMLEVKSEKQERHLTEINGSIERFTQVGVDLTRAMQELSGDIRTLQENGRLSEARAIVAATTLATETERRRLELTDALNTGDRKFTHRERLMTLLITCSGLAASVYFATH